MEGVVRLPRWDSARYSARWSRVPFQPWIMASWLLSKVFCSSAEGFMGTEAMVRLVPISAWARVMVVRSSRGQLWA